ncbi:hypothetical protein [Saccharothrix sp. ST-888]|uniref:hypothetical protein n=1 Tax=Saccharothrix sp. ST-888 TaxID=1427391 RepID=UPI0005EC53C4|nr:hypothetical protein [Saccharothrix sp. ST-888]KJK56222.1 hypothetical protein UK12_23850 [Saccharothrix sp. ST-888]
MDERIRASRRQETNLARAVGGRRTSGSGNGWAVKNDVRNEKWSIECKTTSKQSYSLTHKALVAAEKNALLDFRTMAFAVEMCGRTWVVLSYETFASLIEEH